MARVPLAAALLLVAAAVLPSCAPAPRAGSLPPTLGLEDRGGFSIAMQNGIPVPTFEPQGGRRVTLDGLWRVERVQLDSDVSLSHRDAALEPILAEAAGRETPEFDDGGWERIRVPGSLNPPPDGTEGGGWYRREFVAPGTWQGLAATLKFASANYVADVWLNGTWLGYHEGGYTPFAFDASEVLLPGSLNSIAVRVDNPPWGTRNDIVPWGLADWWNYGGLTGSVWLEADQPVHAVRADIVPHLDGFDVRTVVRHAGQPVRPAGGVVGPVPSIEADQDADEPERLVRVDLYAAVVTPQNVTQPGARALVPSGAEPLAGGDLPFDELPPGEVTAVEASFLFGGADLWSPASPALYVLHVSVVADGEPDEGLWTSFGLRHVSVEPEGGRRLLLNGEATMLTGVALHDEVLTPAEREEEVGGRRVTDPDQLLGQLDRAREVGATLIRAGHTPANPLLLMLADRLGFAVWEEIPLYHFTPLTFGIAMDRGIPQQMLREMALRDMNRPSVLFHGLANESTGTDERQAALATLHDIDREIDGTRLTGQAAYGFDPDDPTHAPLDVAGFTFYYEVFYGADAAAGTGSALTVAHATHPDKPIIVLEFGRWADDADGPERQRRIFEETFPQFAQRSALRENGFVGAAVWWTLTDYATLRPGILIEHFGLYDASGTRRPAGDAAASAFAAVAAEAGPPPDDPGAIRVEQVIEPPGAPLLLIYLGYAVLVSVGLLGGLVALLVRTGGRSVAGGRRTT